MTATGFDTLPKRAIWFWGGSPMSFLRYMSLVSFRKYHPDWDMLLVLREGDCKSHRWDIRQDSAYYAGPDYTEEAMAIKDLAVLQLEKAFPDLTGYYDNQVSDAIGWRWAAGGGIKCDMDLLWRAPIDYDVVKDIRIGLWQYRKTFAVGVVLGNEPGFFGAIDDKALERLGNNRAMMGYQEVGPNLLRDMFPELEAQFDVTILPNSWLYPFVDSIKRWATMCARPFLVGERPPMPDDCVAVHWYAGSDVAMGWNAKPEREMMGADNLMGDMVREALQ